MPKKQYLFFLSFVITSVLLMTYQSHKGALRPFGFLTHYLNSVNRVILSVDSSIKGTIRKITLREEEFKELREEIRTLRLKEQGFQEVLIENQRLRTSLSLKERLSGYVAASKVISRGSGRWSNTFVIDKGMTDGIEKGMAVITPEGLLGKIHGVQDSTSSVLLIDDMRFSAAVRLQTSRSEAVLSGAGPGQCVLKYVQSDTEVKEGETVVTSGLDTLFPAGISAGYVSKVSTNKEKLFHDIKVTPFVDTRKVEEVIIVKR